MYTVYLAGPITGCSFEGCTDWRGAFETHMPDNIRCLSPMRGKDYLQSEGVIVHDYPQHLLSCQRGIMTRDFFDCMRADLVVVNLSGAKIVSVGTVMEIAWAYANKTPIVCIMEPEGNLHDHPMIREAIGFRVETLEQAAETTKIVLFPPGLIPAAVKIPSSGINPSEVTDSEKKSRVALSKLGVTI